MQISAVARAGSRMWGGSRPSVSLVVAWTAMCSAGLAEGMSLRAPKHRKIRPVLMRRAATLRGR